jgi:hypothetical protein
MTFKVTYNYKPHSFDENGKYIDNDTFTISIKDIDKTVNEKEIYELYRAIKDAIADRDDTRGYHE